MVCKLDKGWQEEIDPKTHVSSHSSEVLSLMTFRPEDPMTLSQARFRDSASIN